METPPPPSKKVLNRARLNFGLVNILSSGDEGAFSPFHTVIVRALGGGDTHLGFIGGVMSSLPGMFAWLGAIILRLVGYNRRALMGTMFFGCLVQCGLIVLLVLAAKHFEWAIYLLYSYLGLITLTCIFAGAGGTITMSWIGDLVPVRQRGWFVGGMSILSNVGLVLFQFLFAQLATKAQGFMGYAALVALCCATTFVAVLLCLTIPDSKTQAMKFMSRDPAERVDYWYRPLWLLVWFECAWRIGRISMAAFTTAYLLDYFGLKLDRIILIYMLVNVVNIFMLYVAGNLSDRIGNRYPLAIVTCVCAASMLLWVGSAWWGVWAVIAYQIINGMSGSTHWMLLTNLSLQVYPPKGRANFLSFSRTFVGVMGLAGSTAAGYLLASMRGWSINFWGADFNYYHVFFLGCTMFTFTCMIPLWFLGKMKMPDHDASELDGEKEATA